MPRKLARQQRVASLSSRASRDHAVARIVGKPNICILGLNPRDKSTIKLDSNARISGTNCAVFSNSTSASGISSRSNAVLKATTICSAGGKDGSEQNFEPRPLFDCPTFNDPLASRPAPQTYSCTHTNMRVVDERRTLGPGTYCGGLVIDGNSNVTLSPGVYVIQNGELRVASNSIVTGNGTGFYLQGATSRFVFTSNASVSLEAPESGPMAGLLFFSDRAQSGSVRNEILSNYTRVLVGTIYLPNAELIVDADQAVADQSAFTAIVAQRIVAQKGPHLVLNTNYNRTASPFQKGSKAPASRSRWFADTSAGFELKPALTTASWRKRCLGWDGTIFDENT